MATNAGMSELVRKRGNTFWAISESINRTERPLLRKDFVPLYFLAKVSSSKSREAEAMESGSSK
jgi:hypothetical protein